MKRDLVLLLELAHFVTCMCDEEYLNTKDFFAPLRDATDGLADGWWIQIRALRLLHVHDLRAAELALSPPQVLIDLVLQNLNGSVVSFGACASLPPALASAAAAAAVRGADELERFMQASGLVVLRKLPAATLLQHLFDGEMFEADSWVWVEQEEEASSPAPVQHAPAQDIFSGNAPLPGLSEAAPACIGDRMPVELVAAAAHVMIAFTHTSIARRGDLRAALIQAVAADEAFLPAAARGPEFSGRLGSWFLYQFLQSSNRKGQLWSSFVADDKSYITLLEWGKGFFFTHNGQLLL